MFRSVRVVLISEEKRERESLAQTLSDMPGVAIVAEVDRVCHMGRQAGHVGVDCVVLDIDCHPMAGTLALTLARAIFRDARIVVLARSVHPRYPQFLKESGASCCIDKDDPGELALLVNALGLTLPQSARVAPQYVWA
jgi:DNA-binding NarL/FixJ family response regulator